ncbi:MAG TPA: calcium/sodium antiporter [Draconibacterium sp.]|jgi:cation:H+ antiporter|nr:calcium/sodium antiporter [Draconibacterium sp.]
MIIAFDIAIIIITILLIAKGAAWLVDSSVRIARRFNISELVIGLTVIAIGTSAPEFAVTVTAAIRNMGDISVGNIVGSNIFNLGLILGGTAIFRSLKTSKKLVYRDGTFLLAGTIALTLFLWDSKLSFTEGVILFTSLIVYLGYLYWKKDPVNSEETENVEPYKKYDPLLLILSLALIVGSSHFLVESASDLAAIFGISQWVIGATIVAAGTSAPEFATALVAAYKGHHGMSVGNLIGSDIFNMFGVLGVASIIRELPVDAEARTNMLLLVGMVLLVIVFMRTNWKIGRVEGIILVMIGLSRWFFSFSPV